MRSPTRRRRVLQPVKPNAGTTVAYRREMDAILDLIQQDILRLVHQYYVPDPAIAQDAPPRAVLQMMRMLARNWQNKLDTGAPELARYFMTQVSQRSDAQLRRALEKAGIAVRFQMTPAQHDVLDAAVQENVRLIKSIAERHLGDVEGIISRAFQAGRDVGAAAREIEERYDVSKARAQLIARHQNSAVTASLTRARQLELGVETAVWMHSHGVKEPRPTHLANDGETYDVRKGWFDPDPKVRAWIFPGTLINCGCYSRIILPGMT